MPVGLRCPACQHKFIPGEPGPDGKIACPQCGRSLRLPKPTPDDPLVGRAIAGHQLLRRLGTGAMAAVYEARPLAGGAPVAIKMLTSEAAKDDETVQRFQREAALARSVDHPHVVGVTGHGTENGVHWMAMELVTGQSLEAVIDSRKRLPWQEAARVVEQIGDALAHLAAKSIIHRDVKPANILLGPGGIAKLTDLGFAKALSAQAGDGDAAGLTMAGMAMGSPAYMAPEQVLDAKEVTSAADFYGLGASFYHAVTGATPFDGSNAYQVMEKVVSDVPPAPRTLAPDLPAGVAAFIEWTLAKQVSERPVGAATWMRELRATIAAPHDAARIQLLRRPPRTGVPLWVWVAVAAVLLAAASFAVLRAG